jgi:hypothetical protein
LSIYTRKKASSQPHLSHSIYNANSLNSIEDKLETRSITTTCFRNGNLAEPAEDNDNDDLQHEIHLTRRPVMRYPLIGQNIIEDSSLSGFEDDLGKSRVYKRTERYESDVSFSTSVVRDHAWSVFSGMSLSEISLISAIALPLHLDEVSNQEWYMLCENTDISDQIPCKTENTVVLYKMVMMGDHDSGKQQLSIQVKIPSDFLADVLIYSLVLAAALRPYRSSRY